MPVTNYIWDEVNDTLLMEKDEDGNTMASYTYEPGRYGPLISQHRGGQSSYYQFDGQGSRRQLTDANQNVTDSTVYTAFGETVACSGTTTNPFGYKGALGYYANFETNDLHVRRRTYQALVARWSSLDPAGHSVLSFGISPYCYVRNRSLRLIDPSGLAELDLAPASATSMPWYADQSLNFGLVGRTLSNVSFTRKCTYYRRPEIIFRRRSRLRISCRIAATFRIVIFTAMIEGINDTGNEEFDAIRDALKREGLPLPTLAGTYGHEQRHVQSMQALLRKLANDVSLDEARYSAGVGRCLDLCQQRAGAIEAAYSDRLRQIDEGEKHGTTGYPVNPPPSPQHMVDYPPDGVMPPEPAGSER